MFGESQDKASWGNSWKFALILSVLIHVLFVPVFILMPIPKWAVQDKSVQKEKQVSRNAAEKRLVLRKQERKDSSKDEEKKQAPEFVKTSSQQEKADQPVKSPYIGARSTKASGGPKAPDDMREMPAQDGAERKDEEEIVLFDQSRQDGAMEHDEEGSEAASSASVVKVRRQAESPERQKPMIGEAPERAEGEEGSDSSLVFGVPHEQSEGNMEQGVNEGISSPESMQSPDSSIEPSLEHEEDLAREQGRSGNEAEEQKKEDKNQTHFDESALRDKELPQSVSESKPKEDKRNDLARNVMANERVKPLPLVEDVVNREGKFHSSVSGNSSGEPGRGSLLPPPLARQNRRPVYDPVFSESAQPGFRTTERRTRTSGKFSFGRNPSLDVEATPTGRYQEFVYRAVAGAWYAQCDRNRDLIVTGTLRVRILLDPTGNVVSMRLLGRSGASVAQNSFTFLSIKQAPIPPMPPEVKKELIGERMELFFDFHF